MTNENDDDDIVNGSTQVSITDPAVLAARGAPTAEDLAAMPATSAEDWKDAELLIPLPPDIARLLADRFPQQKAS